MSKYIFNDQELRLQYIYERILFKHILNFILKPSWSLKQKQIFNMFFTAFVHIEFRINLLV